MAKKAAVKRKTKETDIDLSLAVNRSGAYSIDTQVPFLTHMIEQLSRHSNMDISLKVKGDIQVDAHHITEDTGIVIGKALAKALGDKKGIAGLTACGVLDEALVGLCWIFPEGHTAMLTFALKKENRKSTEHREFSRLRARRKPLR